MAATDTDTERCIFLWISITCFNLYFPFYPCSAAAHTFPPFRPQSTLFYLNTFFHRILELTEKFVGMERKQNIVISEGLLLLLLPYIAPVVPCVLLLNFIDVHIWCIDAISIHTNRRQSIIWSENIVYRFYRCACPCQATQLMVMDMWRTGLWTVAHERSCRLSKRNQ